MSKSTIYSATCQKIQDFQKDSDSLSSHKHLVYGLRKLYRLFDREELHLALPKIKASGKLPVEKSLAIIRTALKQTPPPDSSAKPFTSQRLKVRRLPDASRFHQPIGLVPLAN